VSADPLAAVTPTYLFYLGRSACGRNECRRRVVVARRTAVERESHYCRNHRLKRRKEITSGGEFIATLKLASHARRLKRQNIRSPTLVTIMQRMFTTAIAALSALNSLLHPSRM